MKVVHFEEIPLQEVTMEGAQGCKMRHLIGEPDGAPNFTMRQFEVAADIRRIISIITNTRCLCSQGAESSFKTAENSQSGRDRSSSCRAVSLISFATPVLNRCDFCVSFPMPCGVGRFPAWWPAGAIDGR